MIVLYYAHRTDLSDKNDWQLLTEHLEQVSDLAGNFASEFNAREWGELTGLLHDIGKFSTAFQKRLEGSPLPVDHATAGAQYISSLWDPKSKLSRLIAYVIAGHHAGLADYGTDQSGDESTLARRLLKPIKDFETALNMSNIPSKINTPIKLSLKPGIHPALQLSLFTRMLFSCLVDADSLNTEAYAEPKQSLLRQQQTSFTYLNEKFTAHMATGLARSDSQINMIRNDLLAECLVQADNDQGLYTLTLPTGSGKTLISLGFALKHTIKHSLKRIIYVIPYTSIIEQNAQIFRNVLGEEYVLEHHSNVQHEIFEEKSEDFTKLKDKLMLAEENWDYPIVVTTNVQFFESLYSNKRSRCRKLHNLSKSIIILDEAQMMNGEFFKPCMYVLEELTRNYGVTVILSTATQPNVVALFSKPITVKSMIQNVPLRFEQFRRVRLEQLGRIDYDLLSTMLSQEKQGLCIVNTRRAAREIYDMVLEKQDEGVYHLSARMCPKHRLHQLRIIRDRLKNSLPCILISTQLIECGVDIDFPTVYRELAGLDSIGQAAGRCNRNALKVMGTTYVFETEATPMKGWFGMTAGVTRSILDLYKEDPLSLEAVQAYFRQLYFQQTLGTSDPDQDMTDKYRILSQLNERNITQCEFPFRTIAEDFRLIDTATKAVIIPYDTNAEKELESLKHALQINGIMRKLQLYIVQLYPQEFEAFRRVGDIIEVRDQVFKLQNMKSWYTDEIGVKPYSEEDHAREIYCY